MEVLAILTSTLKLECLSTGEGAGAHENRCNALSYTVSMTAMMGPRGCRVRARAAVGSEPFEIISLWERPPGLACRVCSVLKEEEDGGEGLRTDTMWAGITATGVPLPGVDCLPVSVAVCIVGLEFDLGSEPCVNSVSGQGIYVSIQQSFYILNISVVHWEMILNFYTEIINS